MTRRVIWVALISSLVIACDQPGDEQRADWTAGLSCTYSGDSVSFTTTKSIIEAHLVGPNADRLALNIPTDTLGSVTGKATTLDTLHVQSRSGGSDCVLAR